MAIFSDTDECLNILSQIRLSLAKCLEEEDMSAKVSEVISNALNNIENICAGQKDKSLDSAQVASNDEDIRFSGRESILVVEDDSPLREKLASELRSDYHVWTAPDGSVGLKMAKEKSPDIIISDIGMPKLDGIEMCNIIKSSQETSHIPVVLLTGKQDKQTIIHGFESGADDYLIKPYDLSVLNARIRNILDERQRIRDRILNSGVTLPSGLSFVNRLDKEFMNKVLKVIESEMSNSEFQMDHFCRQLAMSRTALYNKLKALTGMSPNDFVRMIRLNKAKDLLSCRIYNVTEVSEMVGFSDPKYFSICFKKQFNISPSKI